MTVTIDQAAEYLHTTVDAPLLGDLLMAVTAMVDNYLGTTGLARIPSTVHDLAVLLSLQRAWAITHSSSGVVQYEVDGTATFLPADILKPAYPTLNPYRAVGRVG
jgi:hypothetical protein